MNPQQETHQQQQIVKKPHAYQESSRQYVGAPYTHQEFPKWKYHPDKNPILVHNQEQETRLGAKWSDGPGMVKEAIQGVPEEKEEAKATAELRQENRLKRRAASLEKKKKKKKKKKISPPVRRHKPVKRQKPEQSQNPETESPSTSSEPEGAETGKTSEEVVSET